MHEPTKEHLAGAKLNYLKDSLGQGILLSSIGVPKLTGYCSSN